MEGFVYLGNINNVIVRLEDERLSCSWEYIATVSDPNTKLDDGKG